MKDKKAAGGVSKKQLKKKRIRGSEGKRRKENKTSRGGSAEYMGRRKPKERKQDAAIDVCVVCVCVCAVDTFLFSFG